MRTKQIMLCILFIIGIMGIAPALYSGNSNNSTSIDDVQQETRELINTLASYSVDQRKEAVQKAKKALDNMDKRIHALQAHIDQNWAKMNKNAQDKARTSLKTLQNKREQVTEWYKSLKSGSKDAWEHAKEGFSNAYTGLNKAWQKSKQEFDSDNGNDK